MKKNARHSRSRDILAIKGLKIRALVNPYLDEIQLQGYGICVSQIDLIDAERFPKYFLPATVAQLASLTNRRPVLPSPPQPGDYEFPEEDERSAREKSAQARFKGSELLNQLTASQEFEWEGPILLDGTTWKCATEPGSCRSRLGMSQSTSPKEYPQDWSLAFHLNDLSKSRPHQMCVLYQGVENTGPLLKSEVLTAISLLMDTMITEWSEAFDIFPLLIVSMIGTQGRILQVHYDDNKLYIQYSRLYEFKDYNRENVDLFVRWMISKPIDDTVLVQREKDDHT